MSLVGLAQKPRAQALRARGAGGGFMPHPEPKLPSLSPVTAGAGVHEEALSKAKMSLSPWMSFLACTQPLKLPRK